MIRDIVYKKNEVYQGIMKSIQELINLQKHSHWQYPELKRMKRKFDFVVDQLDEIKKDFDKLYDRNADEGIDKDY